MESGMVRVRFRTIVAAAVFGFAGAFLGSAGNWPTAAALRAQIAGALATDVEDERQAAYNQLDRDAKAQEQPSQLTSLVKRAAKLTAPSVVHIEAKKREGARNGRT